MKAKTIITTTILSVVGVIICSNRVSALEYSSSAGVNFTISPSISVSVSGDLIIDELAPGSSSDSNIITVTVATNSLAGYHLSTTVGTTNTNYTDLRLNSNDNTNKFTNLSTNKASLSNFSDNTWGYSYSVDSGTNWISGNIGSTSTGYNGLPLDNNDSGATGVTLIDTKESTSTNPIQFKIGAKASNVQAAGEYTNTINFYAVTYQEPLSLADSYAAAGKTMYNGYYKMQDMSPTICSNVTAVESQLQVIDVRDNNVYTIAKLKDNRCWMTSNLNLEGGTAISAEDTDVDSSYISNFTTSNNLIKNDNTIILPASSTTGFDTNNYSYVYNSGNITNNQADCTNTQPCNSYYSWDAVTLGSGRTLATEDTDAPYSICPKGWKLPTSGDSTVNDPTGQSGWKRGDFYRLATAYEVDLSNSSDENIHANEDVATPNDKIGPGTVANFLRAERFDKNSFAPDLDFITAYGRYWSSTSYSANVRAHFMIVGFRSSDSLYFANSADKALRRNGHSIRCIANNQ